MPKDKSSSISSTTSYSSASTPVATFRDFKLAIQQQFSRMVEASGGKLFRVAIPKDTLWDTYLASFPPGANPLFRERTEHDCQCCKHFVRAVGGLVVVLDNTLVTLWDCFINIGEPYGTVGSFMSGLVRSALIENVLLSAEKTIGTDHNAQQAGEHGEVIVWHHFHLTLPAESVVKGVEIGPRLSDYRATHDVLLRSLEEIRPDALETVLELISQNSLYRGEEHKFAVDTFQEVQREYHRVKQADDDKAADAYVWSKTYSTSPLPQSVSRIRNTVIGTLLTDLSEGKELEEAVKSFEQKVAPTNYKRPTALVTKAMIEKAQAKIAELGLTEALERRFARLDDITVNNILFADRGVRRKLGSTFVSTVPVTAADAFSSLTASLPSSRPSFDKVEEVGVEKFLADVLPRAAEVEVWLENRHAGNMVSLVAPRHTVTPSTPRLFKWDNQFSWSYTGELADSIKERVKRAGGQVEGDLCCRLAWDYTDDLDFHMKEPGGFEIYYPNRRQKSPSGGELDLDANGADGLVREPAENIFYADRRRMREGVYQLFVHNYCRRSTGQGFEVEVEFDGQRLQMGYGKVVRYGEVVQVARISYSHREGFKVIDSLPSSQTSRELWGMATQTWQPVEVVMLSPNYWDGQSGPSVGNKHYFWMLARARNDGQARGFFNEFLRAELDQHRKVLEVVGSKMKTPEVEEWAGQLSGLGFSSTKRDWIMVKVRGSFERVVKVVF